ncbi:M14 family metallopeptidase [Lysobacter solisilvae (ex Woo and Kim 2020)]|uniref:M14 family metallopeptidase n=1 Tax=Agrilutibacter terrestris TaxID=2865112 RepID=A0A7H0FXZ8_9GAMM|nr:M14 family metallopeptidase [Lysobacter terrestris]QNP40914.1 M14 family metallopeptidase [Lysobacter terrestris]
MPRTLLLPASLISAGLALALAATAPAAASTDLATVSERSGFVKTGRYDEVIALCEAFQQRYPDAVRCFDFGTTPEGRPMKALAVSRTGKLQAQAARDAGLPVLLVQGGIHAGEIDGKDAGFLLLRELLDGKRKDNPLDRLVLVFVPVFNVDGHERFAAWNRPNQRGPEEMGWRTTAQNYNLNRDYVKADAPEMQAMLRLANEWDPLAMMDLHVTDGAKFRHDISIMVEPTEGNDAPLRKVGKAWRDGVIARLKRQGSLPLPFYPSFVEYDNPASGFEHGVAAPRFSQSYFAQRNRLGMLVETHSWKDYPTRVRITRNTVLAAAELIAAHGRQWLQDVHAADERAAQLAGQPVALDYKATDKARTIAFQGYAYTRTPSEVSGALMTRYDENTPQVWHIPLRDEVVPDHVLDAPRAGYLVPAAHAAWVGAKLQQHGIEFRRLDAPLSVDAQAFHASETRFSAQSFEGHQTLTATGAWQPERRDVAAGSLFVPIAQAKARLVMTLLEPQAGDSLLAWGEFNPAFERKEYMEDYVAEEVARDMLARDPALKARFEQRLKDDAAFAKDASARLEFFARLHSSWDQAYNVYPVLRIDHAPAP